MFLKAMGSLQIALRLGIGKLLLEASSLLLAWARRLQDVAPISGSSMTQSKPDRKQTQTAFGKASGIGTSTTSLPDLSPGGARSSYKLDGMKTISGGEFLIARPLAGALSSCPCSLCRTIPLDVRQVNDSGQSGSRKK